MEKSQDNVQPENVNDVSDQGVVKYDTYKRVLGTLKNREAEMNELKSKLEAYEQQERSLREKELESKGQYEQILNTYKSKINEYENKLTTYEKNLMEGQKLNAFLDALPGRVKKQEYLSFVPTDEIALDPTTGMVDEHSVKVAVSKFVEHYSDLITPANSKTLPQLGRVGQIGAFKKDLNSASIEELRQAFLRGNFKE